MKLACLVVFAVLANRPYAPDHIYGDDVHGHSAISDGQGTPDDYFTWARDVAELDFFILTNHNFGNGRPQ